MVHLWVLEKMFFWKDSGQLNIKDKVCDLSATSTTKWTCLFEQRDWEHHWLNQCHEFSAILWSNNGRRGSVFPVSWHSNDTFQENTENGQYTPCAQLTRWNHDDLAMRTPHTLFGGITTYSQLVRQRCCQIPQNTFFVVFRLLLWRTRREN